MRTPTLVVALVAAIGCSDATSPSSSTARHLDALLQQACAQADADVNPSNGYILRCELLSDLVTGPASGAEPSPLQVITAGTTSTEWRGLVIAFAETDGGFLGEPNYLLIAYSDPNVTNVFVGQTVLGSETTPYLVLGDTELVMSGAGGGPFVDTVSTGARCTDTPGLANPLGDGPIAYSGSMCRIATFSVLETAAFPVSGADSGFASVSIPAQDVTGILVTNPPVNSYFRRIR
jgi:hypothetical protein